LQPENKQIIVMITRQIEPLIRADLQDYKRVVLILGPRQVGKTTLLETMREGWGRVKVLNCESLEDAALLEDRNTRDLRALLESYDMVQIDEAQKVKDIGLTVKRIGDLKLPTRVMVTGSSALELADGIYDTAVGRVWKYTLYPFSLAELAAHTNQLEEQQLLAQRMVYGLYPDVVNDYARAKENLSYLVSNFLYRDALAYRGVKKPEVLKNLVQALAFQVGSEVSYNELGKMVGVDKATVENYINLLEKCFIVFRINTLSRNPRNEIRRGKKVYFYDNGVRNAVINAFAPPALRSDVGALWENLMVSERVKRNAYCRSYANIYFWRSTSQSEVDLVEECDGVMHAYEFKWNVKARAKMPQAFQNNYPNATFAVVNPENYWDFVR